MTRRELEHLIRAAAGAADEDDLVVVGSQAILGQFPDAPAELLRSVEADLYPRNAPEKADLIPISSDNTRDATGWCVELHDLMISKYAAGCDKDRTFVRAAITHGMVDHATLLARLAATSLDEARRAQIAAAIEHDFSEAAGT